MVAGDENVLFLFAASCTCAHPRCDGVTEGTGAGMVAGGVWERGGGEVDWIVILSEENDEGGGGADKNKTTQ